METRRTALVLTIGTELCTGLRVDTNGPEVSRVLTGAGYAVDAIVSVPDDADAISAVLADAIRSHDLVITTGGLGPTHDDVTREAAAAAVGRPLVESPEVRERLAATVSRHREPGTAELIFRQALVVEGARVLTAVAGTAPGQAIETPGGLLVLLPGPPFEMRPMLADLAATLREGVPPVRLTCTGITESDAGVRALRALQAHPGVSLTLLAAPGEVEVILFADRVDAPALAAAGTEVRAALGDACFASDGTSLAATVLRLASARGERIATAESCTGGMVAAALTDVPGASDAFVGGMVTYDAAAKTSLLGVPEEVIASFGEVSEQTAVAMAEGALSRLDASLAVAVTGIAGPSGGSPAKPVGLVWFALARTGESPSAVSHTYSGDRSAVRQRATATALDLLRRAML